MTQIWTWLLNEQPINNHIKQRLIWCLIVIWVVYSGLMLWHLKERNGWVASLCRTQQ